jgi:hypothetical protein
LRRERKCENIGRKRRGKSRREQRYGKKEGWGGKGENYIRLFFIFLLFYFPSFFNFSFEPVPPSPSLPELSC